MEGYNPDVSHRGHVSVRPALTRLSVSTGRSRVSVVPGPGTKLLSVWPARGSRLSVKLIGDVIPPYLKVTPKTVWMPIEGSTETMHVDSDTDWKID